MLSDPRVRMLVADGRNALLARDKTYDVIISDPSDVWVAGVGNLFTQEFYALARRRLKPGGVMVQWFHMHSLPPEQMKLIVATFRSVFPSRIALAAEPGRRHPDRRRRALALGPRAPAPALRDRSGRSPRTCAGSASGTRSRSSPPSSSMAKTSARMLADARGLHTDDLPVVEYLSPRAGRVDTTSANDAGAAGAADEAAAGDRGVRREARPRRPRTVPARLRPGLDRPRRPGDSAHGGERSWR